MSRYIDADALLEILNSLYDHHLTMRNFAADGATKDCIDAVIEAPTADVVEVRHGRLIDKTKTICGQKDFCFVCSECGYKYWYQIPFSFEYCAHCGAKMDGERREE